MTHTTETIKNLIATNTRAVERAILALYNRQEEDEKEVKETGHKNGRGFNSLDANILSSFAEQLLGTGTDYYGNARRYAKPLTEKQVAAARKMLPKYAGQLLEVAAEKSAALDTSKMGDAELRKFMVETREVHPQVTATDPSLQNIADRIFRTPETPQAKAIRIAQQKVALRGNDHLTLEELFDAPVAVSPKRELMY